MLWFPIRQNVRKIRLRKLHNWPVHLLFTSMFKDNPTSVFHLSVQIKKLSLIWNKIGNSGAKALATCLWNIDELDLGYCDITECEELCNAIQSLKRPVSFNLVSSHTVL